MEWLDMKGRPDNYSGDLGLRNLLLDMSMMRSHELRVFGWELDDKVKLEVGYRQRRLPQQRLILLGLAKPNHANLSAGAIVARYAVCRVLGGVEDTTLGWEREDFVTPSKQILLGFLPSMFMRKAL